MNFKKIAVVFCLLIYGCNCWATILKIEDKSYTNIPLRVYAYENILSHNLQLVATAKVNEQGKAEIKIPLKKSQLLYIPILSFHLVFYAEPNRTITLDLPNFQQLKKGFKQLKSYTGREIPLFVKEENSLNTAITLYDKKYNAFLRKNFDVIYNKKNAEKFRAKISSLSKLHNSNFFKTYATYKEAYLDYVAGLRTEILPTFYANKPLLLYNTAYVSLLKKIAKEPAIDFPHNPNYKELFRKFSQAKNYNSLKTIYEGLAKTNDVNFNEHFFIYMLKWSLQKKLLPKKIILKKLELIAKYSPNKINTTLAKSILEKSEHTIKEAIPFNLQATNGKNYTEKVLTTDKPTLLAFFDSASNNTESIKVLNELQTKHKNAFNIVVFSCENKIMQLPENWLQFTVPYHNYLLSDYRLGRFPYYVLITNNGKISKQTWQQYLISLEE